MATKLNKEPALGVIPSTLNAIAAVGEAIPKSFTIPAPKGPITGIIQAGLTRKEQVQDNVLKALPKGISEGISTRSAQGFALGLLSGMVTADIRSYRADMNEVKTAARNASESGTITIRNPLSFYVPKSSREAISTLLTHLVDNNFAYQTMEQAPQTYTDLVNATRHLHVEEESNKEHQL